MNGYAITKDRKGFYSVNDAKDCAEGETFSETLPAIDTAAAVRNVAARDALAASDTTVLRCLEKGTPLPANWQAYRQSLRDVISGKASTLPARPAYP